MDSTRIVAKMVVMAVCMALLAPALSHAGPKVVIKPSISTSVRYDDNYYEAEDRERPVYTYRVSPGVEVGYQTARTQITADYTLRLHWYDDADDLQVNSQTGKLEAPASDADFVGHRGVLDIRTKPLDRITLMLNENYLRTREAGQADKFSNSTSRAEYYVNRISPGIAYEWGRRFTTQARYQSERLGYVDDSGEDSVEHRGMFDFIYHITPKSSLDMEYQIWARNYEATSSDYLSNRLAAIYRHQINHFGIEASTGYHRRDFDDTGVEDDDTFAWSLSLVGQNPSRPNTARSWFELTAAQDYNDIGTGNEYFKASRLSLSGGHTFVRKFMVGLDMSYQRSNYLNLYGVSDYNPNVLIEREDDTYRVAGKLGYRPLDWLFLNLESGYETRESNWAGRDYDNAFVETTIGLAYNLGDSIDM
ncbi:MAG: hypothetical protein ACLFOY_18470 [Desulfatibacillaceae bacterium]